MEWAAMAFLGAYHGINPGMGWLFAVALGMQEGSARGVWRARSLTATSWSADGESTAGMGTKRM